MAYTVHYKDGALCLPVAAYECRDLLSLRLLMLLSYDRAMSLADDSVLAEQLDCTVKELQETVRKLRAEGLLEPAKKTPSLADKNYTGEDMATLIEATEGMKELIDECQEVCGKIFTPTDVARIVAMRKELSYSCELILLLFFYYKERLEPVGKKLSVSYVEKAAFSLNGQGIHTVEEFEAHIKRIEEENKLAYRLRRLFGVGDRAFTKKEKGFFEKWSNQWSMSFELIVAAYEITVDRLGKVELSYMSRILSDWHEKGITTPEEAEKLSEDYRSKAPYREKYREKTEEASSFDTDEFFAKAIKRSYERMSLAGEDDTTKGSL